jgi:hypothetical protein
MAKPPPNPAATLPVINPAARILGSRHRSNPAVCASESGECSARRLAARNAISKAGLRRLLMFWMVFPGARLADSMTSMTWTTVAPHAKDRGRDDGGLTDAIAPAHGDNAEDAEGQVGDADLELEGIAGRPADGLRNRVRDEDVTEEPTDSASGDTDPKQIQQEEFQPALAGPTTAVQTEMANSDDDRQDGEGEDPGRNAVHASLLERHRRCRQWASGLPLLLCSVAHRPWARTARAPCRADLEPVADGRPACVSRLRVPGRPLHALHVELGVVGRWEPVL